MDKDQLRQRICFDAARLLNSRQENTFQQARWRAARAITRRRIESECLPTDMEIRTALQQLVSNSGPADRDLFSIEDELPSNRFDLYFELLEPMDRVRLDRDTHPEGDLLYHSLQVFELALNARPWDEEFLIAAILHEVGRGIDPYDAHAATLSAVDGLVSERSFWFIENLPTQHRLFDGTIGVRARRRLRQHEDGEELQLLARCDSDGRVPGRIVPELQEALQTIQNLA